ncbi:MAG: HlyD family efflux transporter periplasmic adaptor subunit [Candidatus Cloacimonetes bacterium]|nr:HlyD family efflux transporter periplasmic adaptor subunit [Candidatus Cloacimonadota bacterium]
MLEFKPTSAGEEKRYENHLSEASEEFLYKPIPFILKGPIFIIFFVLAAALLYSFFVQVNIKVTGYLTARGEEHLIVCPFEGTVSKLNVNNNDKVNINSIICEVKSDYIFTLRNKISQFTNQRNQLLLQAAWLREFENAMRKAESTRSTNNPKLQISLPNIPRYEFLEKEIMSFSPDQTDQTKIDSDFMIQFTTLENNINMIVSEYEKTKKDFDYWSKIEKENQELLKKQIIAKPEYYSSLQTMNSYGIQLEQLEKNYKTEFIRMFEFINNTRREISNSLSVIADNKSEIMNSLSGVDYQKNIYSVSSKYQGIISEIYVDLYDYVQRQTPLAKIIRDDYPIIGLMYVSGADISKLKIGQTTTVKFNAYPYQEYGVQFGEVIYISSDVKEISGLGNAYEVHIGFTVENPKIKIKYGYSGISEIIVGKKRLIELVFSPLSKFFDKFRDNQ